MRRKIFSCWKSFELPDGNGLQLYISERFANGFVTLNDYSEFADKCSNYYNSETHGILMWGGADLGVEWSIYGAAPDSEKMRVSLLLRSSGKTMPVVRAANSGAYVNAHAWQGD